MPENWTINRLADETGMDRRTIKKILTDVAPTDIDGRSSFYRLRDFIDALVAHNAPAGSAQLEQEMIRKTSVQADILEVDRARIRNEVIETETVFRVWENIGVAIRRTILTSVLTDKEKDHILSEIRSLNIQDFLEQREFDQGSPAEIS